ncbi:AAA family ATPase [Leucobacter aridicollis]|uniref:AAA family ATPase n=1 Tax=Leucobacter aridicollis TaxID=283878 RepID=UPI0021043FF8|nr:AAA family ATPase [Leucobacter aridicollis]
MTAAPTITGYTPLLYENIAELLERGFAGPPAPEIGLRSDGIGTVYAGHANCVLGPPESGKTWFAQATAVEVLFSGGSVLMIDLDHNGVEATVSRFKAFGIPDEILTDPTRFRYCEPDEVQAIAGIVRDSKEWAPTLVVIDSFGELGPLYGASSNSADDFTNVFRTAVKPFALYGACVIVIDHEAKSKDSASYGATGTSAKKRAYSGTMLRFRVDRPFTPGSGGEAEVTLVKDRNGGLRRHVAAEKEPLVGRFKMTDANGALNAYIVAAQAGETPQMLGSVTGTNVSELVKELEQLDPPPRSVRDVRTRMTWGNGKASDALKAWREIHDPEALTRGSE